MSPLDLVPRGSRIAYLTDIEGIWAKVERFVQGNPLVSLDASGRLVVAPGALFVFGGDAIDRGPAGRRVVRLLLDAKERQPAQVVLLAGNRDINKLRLARELHGFPPRRAPPELHHAPRAVLLRWIFENTMGARAAFEHRREELRASGLPHADEDIPESFLADVAPGGDLARYLSCCQLAFRAGRTLFVHGGVTEENLGLVPGGAPLLRDLDAWVVGLNAWYRAQVDAYLSRVVEPTGTPAWEPLIAYQAPLPGARVNQFSVVYGRVTDELNAPYLLPGLIARLDAQGISRVVLGHTPSGDTPSILRADRFSLLMADNSYGRVEAGARVSLFDDVAEIDGLARLDDGREVLVRASVTDEPGPLGMRDRDSGCLVKGTLPDGDWLLYRPLPGYQLEQRVVSPAGLARLALVPPFR